MQEELGRWSRVEIPHSLIVNSIWKSRYICVLRSTWYIPCLADSCSGRWNWESSTRRMDCASQSFWRETTPIPSSSLYSLLLPQNAEVVYNARDTNSRRLTSGVTISVRNLFARLPIRHKLLSTTRYQQSALTRIRNFLKCLSLIWPKISFEIICENGTAEWEWYRTHNICSESSLQSHWYFSHRKSQWVHRSINSNIWVRYCKWIAVFTLRDTGVLSLRLLRSHNHGSILSKLANRSDDQTRSNLLSICVFKQSPSCEFPGSSIQTDFEANCADVRWMYGNVLWSLIV